MVNFRVAMKSDLTLLVALLADDAVASARETAQVLAAHEKAFAAITDDPNHELLVAEVDGQLMGFCQLSFLPGLTYAGGWRAQIEGVRVAPQARGQGIGAQLIHEAIERARRRSCVLVQLTTDQRRSDALSFYLKMGFVDSHRGMKLRLDQSL
ncbi:MAG: N-acetyltransferase family protein [Lysobacterales bacterium]